MPSAEAGADRSDRPGRAAMTKLADSKACCQRMNATVSVDPECDVGLAHSETANLHRPERGKLWPANREPASRHVRLEAGKHREQNDRGRRRPCLRAARGGIGKRGESGDFSFPTVKLGHPVAEVRRRIDKAEQ